MKGGTSIVALVGVLLATGSCASLGSRLPEGRYSPPSRSWSIETPRAGWMTRVVDSGFPAGYRFVDVAFVTASAEADEVFRFGLAPPVPQSPDGAPLGAWFTDFIRAIESEEGSRLELLGSQSDGGDQRRVYRSRTRGSSQGEYLHLFLYRPLEEPRSAVRRGALYSLRMRRTESSRIGDEPPLVLELHGAWARLESWSQTLRLR